MCFDFIDRKPEKPSQCINTFFFAIDGGPNKLDFLTQASFSSNLIAVTKLENTSILWEVTFMIHDSGSQSCSAE